MEQEPELHRAGAVKEAHDEAGGVVTGRGPAPASAPSSLTCRELEVTVLSKGTVAAPLIILMAVMASGCATTEAGEAASQDIASRHQHLRDAKQGPAASVLSQAGQPGSKPLHDHRQMK